MLGSPIYSTRAESRRGWYPPKEHQGAGFQKADRIFNRKQERKSAESLSSGGREARVLSDNEEEEGIASGSDGKGQEAGD